MTMTESSPAAPVERMPTTTCHWLPCTMDYNGMAPVHMYFVPQFVENNENNSNNNNNNNNIMAAQLRGRGLLSSRHCSVETSTTTTTNSTTHGVVLSISNIGGTIHHQASFSEINEWHHEHSIAALKRQVSQLEIAEKWCQVAKAVRTCVWEGVLYCTVEREPYLP
jgi:Ribonuclease H2 non-catalytic subunit (Ylr154p-like)